MELTGNINLFRNMRETVEFSPIAVEQQGRGEDGSRTDRTAESDVSREDTFTLSDRGRAVAELEQPGAVQNEQTRVEKEQADRETEKKEKDPDEANDGEDKPRADSDTQVTPEEQQVVNELQSTDQKVRTHEQAHAAAGGHNVRYEYETGPDGRQYAVAGTTDIDIYSAGNDPDGKMAQAQKMRSAALAPADPSGQDLAVAAKATRLEMDARREKANAELEEMVNTSASRQNQPAYGYL